jgi:hypothetical protein
MPADEATGFVPEHAILGRIRVRNDPRLQGDDAHAFGHAAEDARLQPKCILRSSVDRVARRFVVHRNQPSWTTVTLS